MYLMNRKESPFAKEDAYQEALKSFYHARAREDGQAQQKRAQRIEATANSPGALSSDPSGGRPWTYLHIKEEQEHLARTEVYLTRKRQEYVLCSAAPLPLVHSS